MQAAAVGRPASHAAPRPSTSVNLRQPAQRLPLTSRLFRREHRHQQRRGGGGASMVTCSMRDPWKTLGVGQNADEKEIKRAHRKLVLKYHPDLTKDDPAAEGHFLLIQEAYEILMGRRRGKELDASADGNSWSFHDWYWRFSMSKRWGRNKKARGSTNPFASEAPPPGAERTQWKSQLDGLKRKAATKRTKQWQQGARDTAAAASTAETAAAAAEAEQQAPAAEAQPFAAAEGRAASRAASGAAQQQRAERASGAQAAAAASGQEVQGQQAAAADGGAARQAASGEPQRQQSSGNAPRHAASGAPFTAQSQSGRAFSAAASSAASSQGSEPADSAAQQGEQRGEHGQADRYSHFSSHPLAGHYQPQHHQPLHHAQQQEHHQQQHWQQGHTGGEASSDPELMLKGLLSQMVGRVTRLGEESGGALQNHVVRLARRASQLGQHLQVQLVRLRALNAANQAGRHHTELHVEFEQAVRSWQQSGHAPGAGSWQHTASAHHAEQPAAGEGPEPELGSSGEEGEDAAGAGRAADAEYVRRSKRFVNDGQVRERVNSQLAGLRRRASIRQEFVVEE